MTLFRIDFLSVCISLPLAIWPDISYSYPYPREGIAQNDALIVVAFTLVTAIIATKIAFMHHKESDDPIKKRGKKLVWAGCYIVTTTILTYFNATATIIDVTYRLTIQLLTGICFVSLLFFSFSYKNEIVEEVKEKTVRYKPAIVPSIRYKGFVKNSLESIIDHTTRCIRLVDDLFLYKKSFQHIIGKFYEWTMLFSEKHDAQPYQPSEPIEISLDDLVRKLESRLIEKMGTLPKLIIEKTDKPSEAISKKIVCNGTQMTNLLVAAVLRITNLENLDQECVKFQLYTTHLQVDKHEVIDKQDTSLTMYLAIALVLSNTNTPVDEIPKVKSCYKHVSNNNIELIKRRKIISGYIDPQKDTIESIIDNNYGYLEYPKNNRHTMLLVIPADIGLVCKQHASWM